MWTNTIINNFAAREALDEINKEPPLTNHSDSNIFHNWTKKSLPVITSNTWPARTNTLNIQAIPFANFISQNPINFKNTRKGKMQNEIAGSDLQGRNWRSVERARWPWSVWVASHLEVKVVVEKKKMAMALVGPPLTGKWREVESSAMALIEPWLGLLMLLCAHQAIPPLREGKKN